MKRKLKTTVYFDEHIHKSIVDSFKDLNYRCLFISKTKKYAGRDEKDYIAEIYSEGAIFVTSDLEFFEYIIGNKIFHSGVVYFPSKWDDETNSFAASGMAGYLKGTIDRQGKRSLINSAFYVADDGYHLVENGKDDLIMSTDAIEIMMDSY